MPQALRWPPGQKPLSPPRCPPPRQAPVRLEEGASVPGARTATCEGDSYFEDCCVFFSLSRYGWPDLEQKAAHTQTKGDFLKRG